MLLEHQIRLRHVEQVPQSQNVPDGVPGELLVDLFVRHRVGRGGGRGPLPDGGLEAQVTAVPHGAGLGRCHGGDLRVVQWPTV